ncbi:hypothetical protein Enr17x_02230 [Gimesia fumaroli]|uniref:Uncharacterized protein n=1 Tax=Gimesia fumaroli TaxID=2527976 RepID=A0A518I527_9PLAN|nr:hypothetical protein Enr17x_02230 [Gimesia fumaroli]
MDALDWQAYHRMEKAKKQGDLWTEKVPGDCLEHWGKGKSFQNPIFTYVIS